jgi:uncharacterized protein (TIGR02145 family)
MEKIILLFGLLTCSLTTFAQEAGTFKDPRDGKVYKTVKIGTQTMMAENLAYKPSSGNYWAYDNDTTNLAKYGYLYDWETAKTIAPAGWHLPTQAEWESLYNYLGGVDKKVFKAVKEGGRSGFNALLCGFRYPNGKFSNIGTHTNFWSSTIDDAGRAMSFNCYGASYIRVDMFFISPKCGYSIRLFQDN